MQQQYKGFSPLILHIVLSLLLLVVFYGHLLFHANSTFFGWKEDGLKNYYTVDYHIRYDSSYTRFSGMNYPYGEHVVFTDNQPLLSNAVKFIHQHLFPLGNYAIGIFNLLLLAGLPLCAYYLYRILDYLTERSWPSAVASVAIAYMSPQLLRFYGHYALAYCFVIPLFIWQLILFTRQPDYKRSVYLSLLMLLCLGVHLYYLVIVGFFSSAYLLIARWRRLLPIKWGTLAIHLFLQVAAPFVLFFAWLKLTDPVTDRPESPYGMLEYMGRWEGAFLPVTQPEFPWLSQLVNVRSLSAETFAYVGLPAALFFVWLLLSLPGSLLKKKEISPEMPTPDIFRKKIAETLFYASLVLFFYATVLPFLFDLPQVAKYLGPLKQFRSLGRLLWVFFYGLNIYFFYRLFTWKNSRWASVFIVTAIAVLATEACLLNFTLKKDLGHPASENILPPSFAQETAGHTFAAIVPIPYFHVGSEILGTPASQNILIEKTLQLSLRLGIPTTGVVMSRTSIHQTLKQLEFANNFSGHAFPQDTRLLLLTTREWVAAHRDRLPAAGKAMLCADGNSLLVDTRLADLVAAFRTDTIDTAAVLYHGQSQQPLTGKGTKSFTDPAKMQVFDGLQYADTVECSFWLRLRDLDIGKLRITQTGTDGTKEYPVQHLLKNVYGDFGLIRIVVAPGNGNQSVGMSYKGEKFSPVIVDECLVTRNQADYAYASGKLLFTRDRVQPLSE